MSGCSSIWNHLDSRSIVALYNLNKQTSRYQHKTLLNDIPGPPYSDVLAQLQLRNLKGPTA